MENNPGGVQIGPGSIMWDDGQVVLELEEPRLVTEMIVSPLSVGSCATGSFCAYTNNNLTGTKISFTNCLAANSVKPLGSQVRSFANARAVGAVHAYNGSTSVSSAVAGAFKNITSTVTRLGC